MAQVTVRLRAIDEKAVAGVVDPGYARFILRRRGYREPGVGCGRAVGAGLGGGDEGKSHCGTHKPPSL